ncbi:MAG TPA: 50S ribosomal protein L25 [Candidatus Sulfotelmatobacter sp.]|nr:50S ribosomal protein L25 [Candidatus Sulfotelmatobacter sp.]
MADDQLVIELHERKVLGKKVKHLRSDGQVPAVIHDHGKPSLHVQGDTVAMLKLWRSAGKHHPVEINTDKKNFTALIKEASFDPKKHLLTHIVFNAVDKDQKVEADIPIKPKYAEENESSPAERAGFIVLTQLETLSVKAQADKLPDLIEYDAEQLKEVGDHITVSDLDIPEGVEVLTELEHAIATVYEPSALAAANDAAGGDAEPGDEAEVESEEGASEEGGETEGKEGEGESSDSKPSETSQEAPKKDEAKE